MEHGVPLDRLGRTPDLPALLPRGSRDRNAKATRRLTILKALSLGYSKTRACQYAGISRDTLNQWIHADEDFARQVKEAVEIGVDVLEDEMRRRAFDGTLEARLSKDQVCYVRRYSDALLALALKARRPQVYRERVEHTGAEGAPLPQAPMSVQITMLAHGFDKLPPHAQERLLEFLPQSKPD